MIVELCSTTDVRDEDNMACRGGRKDVVQYLVEELKMYLGEIYIHVLTSPRFHYLLCPRLPFVSASVRFIRHSRYSNYCMCLN